MSITIEYHEEHRPLLVPVEIKAARGMRVQVLDVKQIGPDLRYQYVVIRGEAAAR